MNQHTDKKHPNSTILKSVSKPGRYAGGEFGQILKDKASIKARFAFCFPDTYEIGMSNLGVRLLYGALNNEPDIWCERVESGDPLTDFDFVGFTLQYEMSYTNVLNMLDLAKIPLRTKDRSENDPLIIGGGPCAYNPEPIADFFDLFNIGEGEDMSTYRRCMRYPTTTTVRSAPIRRFMTIFRRRSPSKSSRISIRSISPTRSSCPTSKRCTTALC